jgi:hypothetical protein
VPNVARGEKATPAPKPGSASKKSGKAAQNEAIKNAMAGQKAAKAGPNPTAEEQLENIAAGSEEPKAKNKVAAAPKVAVDRVAASAARAKESPCEAAAGPKTKPRPCSGVGVVERKVGKRKIMICAAHVLAKELRPYDEAAKAAAKGSNEEAAANA